MPVQHLHASRSPFLRIHNKSLIAVCMMLFFFTLFDGTVSYTAPLAISQIGLSKTMLGFIIGTSSIFGAAFDFVMSKVLTNMHFRRIYFGMFALCCAYPLVLWQAKSVWLFLLAMAIWGIYYDFMNFGTYDFVGRKSLPEKHAEQFGYINMIKALGYLLSPLLVGFVLGKNTMIDSSVIVLLFLFLAGMFWFYFVLTVTNRKEKIEYIVEPKVRRLSLMLELRVWKKIGRILFPVLVLLFLLNVLDSFFWTLGPLLAEEFRDLHPFNGLFLTMYVFPALFVGWFVGGITNRFGKKRTAFVSFFLGTSTLIVFSSLHSPIFILLNILFTSVGVRIALPAINAAFADYLCESPELEKEIEGIADFFTNIGYVVGPISAGLLADRFGIASTFSLLGVFCASVAIFLLIITPKKIHVVARL